MINVLGLSSNSIRWGARVHKNTEEYCSKFYLVPAYWPSSLEGGWKGYSEDMSTSLIYQ